MKKKVYIYRSFGRFWHWSQAILIFLLAATGFEIHGAFEFFGYENAVNYHNIAAYIFMVLIVFTIFWHFTTGEWKHYIPTNEDNLKAQVHYYFIGIFKNEHHPTKKTELSKLNPLQRMTYLGLKILVIPTMVISGLLYMFYRYPQGDSIAGLNVDSVESIALFHTAGAFALIAFVIVHIYLITTGETLTSNLKAMITGYEEIDDESEKSHTEVAENGSVIKENETQEVNNEK